MIRSKRLAVLWGALTLACSIAQGQPVSFVASTIDANGSGDCKAVADLDLDQKGDLILGGSSLAWYDSGAGFARHVIRAQPLYQEFTTDMQAADVDGDGDIDIVVGDGGGGGNILWFENPLVNASGGPPGDPHDGSSWPVHTIGSHGDTVHDIEVADLDNDGKLDVVTSGHGLTHVWKQLSANSWAEQDLSGQAGDGVFIGDIDGDGRKDIATPRGWLRNPGNITTGTWNFYPINQTGTGDECLLADLNADGKLDLVTCWAHDRGPVCWFQQPASATSATWTRRTVDASMGSHHPEAIDFNLDGHADLLMGLELSELSVYMNLGGATPTFQKVQLDTRAAHNARGGDINGDGVPDVMGCDYIGNPPLKIYINQFQPPCYANCDGSTVHPVLNTLDFQCFLNRFAAGDGYANCDESVGAPSLNVLDFMCFINAFASGCQ